MLVAEPHYCLDMRDLVAVHDDIRLVAVVKGLIAAVLREFLFDAAASVALSDNVGVSHGCT